MKRQMMNGKRFGKNGAFGVTLAFLLLGVGGGVRGVAQEAEEPPNIVIIMADDMGYSDLGAYGGEIQTPNLDSLADNGLRFTQFYNTGRCVPSRGSLLTGLYPHQAGVGMMVGRGEAPGYLGRLADRTVTIAEVLGTAGYQSFISGKWHVTHYDYEDPEPTLHRESSPLQRGFDRFYGHLSGAESWSAKRGDWELYDMRADRTETEGLSEEHRERVEELREKWQKWADRAFVNR